MDSTIESTLLIPAATPAANSQNVCLVIRSPNLPGSNTTYRILHSIKVPLIPKPIGNRKRHNNSFIVRTRARPQLWPFRSDGGRWPQQSLPQRHTRLDSCYELAKHVSRDSNTWPIRIWYQNQLVIGNGTTIVLWWRWGRGLDHNYDRSRVRVDVDLNTITKFG